jgi:hypothetical protein
MSPHVSVMALPDPIAVVAFENVKLVPVIEVTSC